MNLKQRILTDVYHYITQTLLFIKLTRFHKVHHKVTSKQKSNELCLRRKKSIHKKKTRNYEKYFNSHQSSFNFSDTPH